LYLLAWTGVFWRNEKLPAELITKGYGFTEEDKQRLIEFFAKMIRTIIPLHRDMAERGMIEISTTPMFHPILPLLADFSSAKEAMPHAAMPNVGNGFGDDYKWHISAAIDYHTETFGSRPMGSWPSEGSVSALVADEYINNGFRWIASDEDILARSLERGIKEYPGRKDLYKQYYREKDGRRINIYFRDKALSDLVGFTYSTWNADAAVDDFLGKLRDIYDNCEFSPHVSVILDGENAWEYYYKNASVFFEKLYKKLAETDWIVTQTMSAAIDETYDTPALRLDRLASGSWIYGNFQIWCGHHEKNRGYRV
jgi:alpha-amylase/alpha-mannosidase (GH57 family)